MNAPRDYGSELDQLHRQVAELAQALRRMVPPTMEEMQGQPAGTMPIGLEFGTNGAGGIAYAGRYEGLEPPLRWETQEQSAEQLLGIDGEKAAKVLGAIGHKQRLDILLSALRGPIAGGELLERLGMGTTGQLYHHIKPLVGANLLQQEERGGRYSVPSNRVLPLLLLLAAANELLDSSDYLTVFETRSSIGDYLGSPDDKYDPFQLLRAVADNAILEHQAGYCTRIGIFVQKDGSLTVSDDGRGIPVRPLPNTDRTAVQAVLTDIGRADGAAVIAPGGGKGINIAVVNALSRSLSVEVKREGRVFCQDYREGIPQTGVRTVGVTQETGTSVTFQPDPELFRSGIDTAVLQTYADAASALYPGLSVTVDIV
ncbi:ATP-binding protein [Paenibacillus methanolicus]|uniref:DNA topoisomerase (ATP-hydrolyzing) n=1 Tax=Paenibacillus methanolicus TaxID=582686 RepID=A0A5S5BM82_9BACL|nr:ATP-binding protein [Paenibacillus methanolicus]TYP68074.1 DNA gyrase subunit B [Paenibacillus methanolicus]